MTGGRRRVWWSTWPGVLGMGLLAFLVAAPGPLAGLAWLVLPDLDSSGLDVEIAAPSPWLTVFAVVQVAAGLVLPVLTARWARKAWLGYVLLGLALCAGVGVVGLVQLGIL